jgi:hypothetical protein
MQSIIQIIKVNDKKSGVKDGRPWELQDCECIILKETGEPDQVGVLPLPKDLRDNVKVGTYIGSFAMRADLRSRRIEAVLTGLQPYAVKQAPAPAAPKAA